MNFISLVNDPLKINIYYVYFFFNTGLKKMSRVSYVTDFEKSVLVSNFEKRGWNHVNPEDDWHFYWYDIFFENSFFKAIFNALCIFT